MDPFIEVFFHVDSDRCGNITVRNLETYVLKNNLDKSMVTINTKASVKCAFVQHVTTEVTINLHCQHPCRTFLFNYRTVSLCCTLKTRIKKREEFYQNQAARLGDDVHVIFQNMSLEQQVLITDEVRVRASQITSDDQIQQFTVDMKQFLDERFGPSWQVLVVDGNFWLTHTYIPNSSFQFNMQDRSFAFWKISD
ncbi:hypothetical protein PHET_05204 [Paragonimus heterotremus]|uniref:EF-hand domain-containing protein n=1 Tax=Paragonimus heterotremus TaxID=100268 RepID=A0A8J4TFN0_9TREM|nr:hypothetical protein PHET_05204 [Paragonimus heterotremus]